MSDTAPQAQAPAPSSPEATAPAWPETAPVPAAAPPPADPPPAGPAPAAGPEAGVVITHAPDPGEAPVNPQTAAMITALQAQLEQVQTQLAAVGAATQPRPERAIPKVMELVTYTSVANTGLPHVRTGLVVSVDEENRKAVVQWLPDAQADMAIDDLDP